jgi:hypothetical protein
MPSINPTELSSTYYWDYFEYILKYIQKHYLGILSLSEKEFLDAYLALSFGSQCLYLRLASRRILWFRVETLAYVEISSIETAIRELIDNGFCYRFNHPDPQSVQQILTVFSKQECLQLAKNSMSSTKGLTTLKKNELVDEILKQIPTDQIYFEICRISPQIIQPLGLTYYSFFQFLFFGSRFRDLTDFVVRDLGHRSFVEIHDDQFVPYFQSRTEAIEKWNVSVWRQWFYEEVDKGTSFELIYQSWSIQILPLKDDITELALSSFEKTVFDLGRYLERIGELERALMVYEHSLQSQAFERRVRILAKLKRHEEARTLAIFGLELSPNPKESHFFNDFLSKMASKSAIKKVTKKLKEADTLFISSQWQNRVEHGVIDYYQSIGYYAVFSENRVWKNLVGLWFWDLIFDTKDAVFHHPFQSAPSHYGKDYFQSSKTKEYTLLLDLSNDRLHLIQHLRIQAEKHVNKANPLVDWFTFDWELLERVIFALSQESLIAVVNEVWKHLSSHSKGFPDIFIQKGNEYAFIEVKSPNDHLSAIQYFWHDLFQQVGIEYKLIRVQWRDL